MTLLEALEAFEAQRPGNKNGEDEKRRWISELDAKIWTELGPRARWFPQTAEGRVPNDGRGGAPRYDTETDPETVLLAPYPYDGVYLPYMLAQAAQTAGETRRYNNERERFQVAWQQLANWVTRTYSARSVDIRWW